MVDPAKRSAAASGMSADSRPSARVLRPADDPAPAPVCLFLGPSLAEEAARRMLPSASIYPPARMGDVYALIGRGVHSIGLIDGVFHGVASIWQRELLAAIDAGIRVLGASSMGALRAAELYPFGMEGVGQVFAWYRDAVIDADDAVALLHNPDPPYNGFSEPLVNVVHALDAAVASGALSRAAADRAAEWMAAQYYPDRQYALLIREAPALGFTAAEVNALRALAVASPHDAIKARDAQDLIARLASDEREDAAPHWPRPALSSLRADHFAAHGWLQRCVLIDGQPQRYAALAAVLDSAPGSSVVAAVRRLFYLQQQLAQLALPPPPEAFVDHYRHSHAEQHGWAASTAERAALALPLVEWQRWVDRLAALAWWVRERLPAHPRFAPERLAALTTELRTAPHRDDRFDSALPGVMLTGDAAERRAQVRLAEECLLADWCDAVGFNLPAAGADPAATLPARLGAISPAELGLGASWDDAVMAFRHLAVSNALGDLIAASAVETPS